MLRTRMDASWAVAQILPKTTAQAAKGEAQASMAQSMAQLYYKVQRLYLRSTQLQNKLHF